MIKTDFDVLYYSVLRNRLFTIREMIEFSGIESMPNFLTMDYAVPCDHKGKYPFSGKAIMLYYQNGTSEIVSHNAIMLIALQSILRILNEPMDFLSISNNKCFEYIQAMKSIHDHFKYNENGFDEFMEESIMVCEKLNS